MSTETEYLLMIDYVAGLATGTAKRHLGVVSEADALATASACAEVEGAVCVEVWTREVPVEWVKAEELLPPALELHPRRTGA